MLDVRFRVALIIFACRFLAHRINFEMYVRNFTLFVCLLEIILLFSSHFQDFILIHVYSWGSFIVTLSYSFKEKKTI